MNSIYKVKWNANLQRYDVVSELTSGRTKTKSEASDSSSERTNTFTLNSLTALIVSAILNFGLITDGYAASTTDNWSPQKNNNLNGQVIIGDNGAQDVSGPLTMVPGASGYNSTTMQNALNNGFAKGDDLTGLFKVDTGSRSSTVVINDPAVGKVTVNIYNNSNFNQKDAGTDIADRFLVPNGSPDFYNNTRFLTVNQNGGVANFSTDANIVGSFKNTQLVFADGRGSNPSTVNWTSSNNVSMYNVAGLTDETSKYNKSISSVAYAGDITAYDGSVHSINNVDDLKSYNNWLVEELKALRLNASAYDAEFKKALITTVHDYEIDLSKGGELDLTAYKGTGGTRTLMYSRGENGTVRIAKDATITGYAPDSGLMYVIEKAKGVNDGVIDVVNTAMRAASGANLTNNGILNVWNRAGAGGTTARGIGMWASNAGTLAINNGVINIRPWNIEGRTPSGSNLGMWIREGAAGINNGVINLTAAPIANDVTSVTEGVRVDAYDNATQAGAIKDYGSTFLNTENGLITVGIDQNGNAIHSAPGSVAIAVGAKSGKVENAGTIVLGEKVQGSYALKAKDTGIVDILNSGQILINGKDGDSPAQNIAIYANGVKGISNTGRIELNGVNGVGLLVEGAGEVVSSGVIEVKGANDSNPLRNYGGWADGQGSKINVSGVIKLVGDGAIGLHARNKSHIDLSEEGRVEFVDGKNQIGFYVYGEGASINNIGTGTMDAATEGSTLFRVGNGASFTGTNGSVNELAASGKNSLAVLATGKNSTFLSGGMNINLQGEGATGVVIEGGAKGFVEKSASINLNNSSAVAGIADGNGHDINGSVINANDTSTLLEASADLRSDEDKVTGYIARNGATLNNIGNINFTGDNTFGIRVQDGSTGINTGSIVLANGGVGLIAETSGSAKQTTINNTGDLILSGGDNANRTTGIRASGNGVVVNMTAGNIELKGQGSVGVEALNGGLVNLAGSALPVFETGDGTISEQIGFRIAGAGSEIRTSIPNGLVLDATGLRSTLFRIEDGASQSGVIQIRTSGKESKGIWATGSGTQIKASAGSDLQILGEDAQGIYIAGGAKGTIENGVSVELVGDGAIVGTVDGNEYDLEGKVVSTHTGSTLTNNANITSPLNNATGFISRDAGLLVNNGLIDFTTGMNNTGVKVLNGALQNSASTIAVNGIAVYVEGENALVNSTGGSIIATNGEAAIKLGTNASLDLQGSGIGRVEGQGTAHGVLIAEGAKGLKVNGARIDVNAPGATGNGIENAAEISDIKLESTTINVSDGNAVRTATSLSKTNSGVINVDGKGIGLAFQKADGSETSGSFDMSDSQDLIVNLKSDEGTGILFNTTGGVMIKTGASVNVEKNTGGSALVITGKGGEVIQSGKLVSESYTHDVVDASRVSTFVNTGLIKAKSDAQTAMRFDSSTDTTLLNAQNAKIEGRITLGGGNNTLVNHGDILSQLTADDGNNTFSFENNSHFWGNAQSGNGDNFISIIGNAHVDSVQTGMSKNTGRNMFVIKDGTEGKEATYMSLDAGTGNEDELIFDNTYHTVSDAEKLRRFEKVKLKNMSTVLMKDDFRLTNDGSGAGSVDIEAGSELAINPVQTGDFAFNHELTGKGVLSVVLDTAQSAFDLGMQAGNQFKGLVKLGKSTFHLEDYNTSALSQATLSSEKDNTTTVGRGNQEIGGLKIDGGTLVFGTVTPGDMNAENTITTSAEGVLDISREGTIKMAMPASVINDIPAIDTRKPLLEQDDATSLISLVNAKGTVKGTGGQLQLIDEKNQVISDSQDFAIVQNGQEVARGVYDYQMVSSRDGINSDGLYIGYGLKEIELLNTGGNALTLTASLDAKGLQTDLRAKVTGDGDLIINADGQTVSLSNGGNDYTGVTEVSAGNLLMANDNVLGNTAELRQMAGTMVKMDGHKQVIGSLNTASGSVTDVDTGHLTISSGGTVNGSLEGNGVLELTGGVLNITSSNEGYHGKTSVNTAAKAVVRHVKGLGDGDINNAGELSLDGSKGIFANTLTGSGLVSIINSGDIDLNGKNDAFSGVFNIEENSKVTVHSVNNLGEASVENSGDITFNTNNDWKVKNFISGSGSLSKLGNGILQLTGNASKFTGITTVENGGLQIGSENEKVDLLSKAVNIAENGTFGGFGSTSGDVNNAGSFVVGALKADSDTRYFGSNPGRIFSVGNEFTNKGSVLISQQGDNAGNTLLIKGDYKGDAGTIFMQTKLGNDDSLTDKLVIEGNTSGTTDVVVNNAGGTGDETINGIEVIHVDGASDGHFAQKGRIVAGAYEYSLVRGQADQAGNWFLTNTVVEPEPTPEPEKPGENGGIPGAGGKPDPKPSPEPVSRPEAGIYSANMAAANTLFSSRLHDRLGETHYVDALTGEDKVTSMWMRNVGGHTRSKDSSGQLSTQSNRYVMQIGGDIAQWSSNKDDRFHLGVMAGYANQKSNTRSDVTHYRADGSISGYSAGVYATWLQDSIDHTGAYVDMWGLYNWFDNDVKGESLSSESYKSKGFTTSIEAGYTWKTGERDKDQQYFIQPKAQITWMGVDADDHHEANGTKVTAEGKGNIQTRLGVRAFIKGRSTLDKGKEKTFEPFVEANWIHNTKTFGTRLNDVKIEQAGTKNIGELKAGVEGQVSRNVNVWGNVAQQIGDKGYSDSSAMLGIKVNF
ncbi:autotransporter outer membrane beta-barrel domain-containing protein [Enterobacter sp. BNK-8]|uniref:autotransporter outer membrane beta-barrel domain-containing protein n=1 Tax=Enterobacter sp. BNK-8 TaxID=3376145 RepID=UPI003B50D12A